MMSSTPVDPLKKIIELTASGKNLAVESFPYGVPEQRRLASTSKVKRTTR